MEDIPEEVSEGFANSQEPPP